MVARDAAAIGYVEQAPADPNVKVVLSSGDAASNHFLEVLARNGAVRSVGRARVECPGPHEVSDRAHRGW